MAERSFLWLFWLLAILGIGLDQTAKYGVFARLYAGGMNDVHDRGAKFWPVIPDKFELRAKFTGTPDDGSHLLSPLRSLGGEPLPGVNKGALFGWLGDSVVVTPEGANMIFALISIVAALAITYWSTRPAARPDRFLCTALGLILAGTVGNLYDRVVFGGVRDFLHFHWDSFDWPVFNLADTCLVCGAFLLLVQAFSSRPAPSQKRSDSKVAVASEAGD